MSHCLYRQYKGSLLALSRAHFMACDCYRQICVHCVKGKPPLHQQGLLSIGMCMWMTLRPDSGCHVRCSTSVMDSGNQGHVLGHIRMSTRKHSYCRFLHGIMTPHAFHAAGEQPRVAVCNVISAARREECAVRIAPGPQALKRRESSEASHNVNRKPRGELQARFLGPGQSGQVPLGWHAAIQTRICVPYLKRQAC